MALIEGNGPTLMRVVLNALAALAEQFRDFLSGFCLSGHATPRTQMLSDNLSALACKESHAKKPEPKARNYERGSQGSEHPS
jgi:hypothetical protein